MAIKKIVIAAGGTGGHLYPAQALAEQLLKGENAAHEFLFMGGDLKDHRCFDRDRFAFQEISASPLSLSNPIKIIGGAIRLVKGFCQSFSILKQLRPQLVVGFGSYHTIPVVLAAKSLGIPIILHEANSIPGKANRWLSPFASHIGVHFPSAGNFFKGKAIEASLPLREGYRLNSTSREEAFEYYRLSPHLQTLLICGGSQGAVAINQFVKECFPFFQENALQLIHLTGNESQAEALASFYRSKGIKASVKPFEHQMRFAWRAADGFIGRSGASTIAEAMEFEVPGILIPYPHSANQHQDINADFLVDTVKGAFKLPQDQLTPAKLKDQLTHLFEKKNNESFKQHLRAYKTRPEQMSFCDLILKQGF